MKTSKTRALAVLLTVLILFLVAQVGVITVSATEIINVSASAGTADFYFTQQISLLENQRYAGVEFELTVSDTSALTLSPYTMPEALSRNANPFGFLTPDARMDGRNDTYTFGFMSGAGNIFSGSLDAGELKLTYRGAEPQSFTLTAMFVHFPDDGRISETLKTETILTVNIVRATTDPGGNGGGNGGGGGGGGGSVPPTVEVDEVETPLVGAESFAAFITGYPDSTFLGDRNMTREEFATILYRIKNPDGLPIAATGDPTFGDVPSGRWSYNAIEWAAAADVVDSGGNFRPSAQITRAEVAEMLARADALTQKAENIFSDIDGHAAYDYILMGVHIEVFEGYPDGTFRPDTTITRYEVVTALVRYLLGGEPTDEMWEDIDFRLVDVARTHWAYKYVALATAGYVAIPE